MNWEVYGDWDDDPARRRTDAYFLLRARGLAAACERSGEHAGVRGHDGQGTELGP